MFFNLFKSNTLKNPIDISVLKTDMHSHLIPGIDDGSKSLEESVRLVKNMKSLGFTKLVTTPHIMYDFFKNNPEIINAGLQNPKEELEKQNIDIEIEVAAEYLIDDGFEKIFKEGKLMTFGDNYVLVELSYYNMFHNFFSLVFELNVEGYKVILAHPERYGYFHDKIELYQELKDRGLFLQLNTISLSGYYTPKVKKIAEKIIDMDLYSFAGSDLHNEEYFFNLKNSLYNPNLAKLIESGSLLNKTL